MNNSVKDAYGNVIGFECWTCGGIYQRGWGTTCNKCRAKANETHKLREEIKRLTKAVESLKNP